VLHFPGPAAGLAASTQPTGISDRVSNHGCTLGAFGLALAVGVRAVLASAVTRAANAHMNARLDTRCVLRQPSVRRTNPKSEG
jgi:hypothetical protein